jgi:hypothetical protein
VACNSLLTAGLKYVHYPDDGGENHIHEDDHRPPDAERDKSYSDRTENDPADNACAPWNERGHAVRRDARSLRHNEILPPGLESALDGRTIASSSSDVNCAAYDLP